jgi:hypothetical protein
MPQLLGAIVFAVTWITVPIIFVPDALEASRIWLEQIFGTKISSNTYSYIIGSIVATAAIGAAANAWGIGREAGGEARDDEYEVLSTQETVRNLRNMIIDRTYLTQEQSISLGQIIDVFQKHVDEDNLREALDCLRKLEAEIWTCISAEGDYGLSNAVGDLREALVNEIDDIESTSSVENIVDDVYQEFWTKVTKATSDAIERET